MGAECGGWQVSEAKCVEQVPETLHLYKKANFYYFLAAMYQDHQDIQGAEEKLCKWTDADTLKAYEQNLLNSGLHKSVAEMLDNWQNPVFDAPGKVRSAITASIILNHLTGHRNVYVHLICLTNELNTTR